MQQVEVRLQKSREHVEQPGLCLQTPNRSVIFTTIQNPRSESLR